ncbi:alanine--glyoxylate aminotransferase family protein [Alicyclobacillus sp.]|uniref:pyridoxal-phosphate-dependent aminotransferase family protein n=1 Tax=Alicyclobacillus sp. TaxID=61169 RepID=UPI0025C117E9|nr:alanine--glyoxylate aminotransferase family protein [Alicyclobacillus sp.]MCL6516863.1 alanine--glyoxylate aminotransferase family protein [Alicyclobacillus sp.]
MRNKEMLLIPGPTPVADEIYDALASETWAHTDPRFVRIFERGIALTKEMFNTDGEVYIFAGSGTLAMEMAIVNTVAPGEKLLVVSHGYFGDRFVQLGRAYGIEVRTVQAEWGQTVDPDDVRQALAEGGFKAVTVTHVDTSTGVAADLDRLVPVVKEAGALFILDGVCATAALEEDMRKEYGAPGYSIDVVLTGSQKAIGVPPGLGIVAFGPQALRARAELGRVPAYFLDIANWRPIMENPGRYFATPPVNMIYAYRRGMEMVMAEGLPARYRRHARLGSAVRAGLAAYGMRALADEAVAAPTLSCILYPQGVDDAAFRAKLAEKGVVVAGALAHLAGKAFRIGHMGNVTGAMFAEAIRRIGETLEEIGHPADISSAVARFEAVYGGER